MSRRNEVVVVVRRGALTCEDLFIAVYCFDVVAFAVVIPPEFGQVAR